MLLFAACDKLTRASHSHTHATCTQRARMPSHVRASLARVLAHTSISHAPGAACTPQAKARAAAELAAGAEARKESTRSYTTPTASPASQRPQRSRAGDVGKPSPESAVVMGAPPRTKRPGSETAAASTRVARTVPGGIGHRQQAATGARARSPAAPLCPSKDVEMAPPPPREPPPATRGELHAGSGGATALMIRRRIGRLRPDASSEKTVIMQARRAGRPDGSWVAGWIGARTQAPRAWRTRGPWSGRGRAVVGSAS